MTTATLPINPRTRFERAALLAAIIGVAAILIYFLYLTPTGHRIREDQAMVREFARSHVQAHPILSAIAFVLIYSVVATFALPVWWVDIIAGYCFGLIIGVLLCHAGSILATLITMRTCGWLLGDWFHHRVEAYHAKLREIDEKLGHNGLLVVTVLRHSHVMPFGISNYLIGLSRISITDAVLGTILGGTFSKSMHVAIGAGVFKSYQFWVGVIVLDIFLLSPLILRYLRPQWFKRVGVE